MNSRKGNVGRKRLLIIGRSQFGYHSDTYFYCKYLVGRYDITYLGWDYERPRIDLDGVDVLYISRRGNKVIRLARLIRHAALELRRGHDYSLLKYFAGCSVIRTLAPGKRVVLDIRTARVTGNRNMRRLYDTLLRFESKLFRDITIISESLAQRLGLPREKAHILPLGADVISDTKKDFGRIDCLYVGTLNNRNMDNTVRGFALFREREADALPVTFTIIGAGDRREEHELAELARKLGVDDCVRLLGAIPHQQLKPYFECSNLGVSYIPLTEYFDCQPPTKTFEYLLSGMPVIATRTTENRRIIGPSNGLLIGDSAESFASGLSEMMKRFSRFDSDHIRTGSKEFTWERIVLGNLQPYLESL